MKQKSSQEIQKAVELMKQNNIDFAKKCLKNKMIIDLSINSIQNLLSDLEEQLKKVKQSQLVKYLPELIPFDDQDASVSIEAIDGFNDIQNILKYLLKTINILQQSYDNNDQIAEQEQLKIDEYEMQQNMEMSQKSFIRKDMIDSSNASIMLILSKLQRQQYIIKDFQMSLHTLLNLVDTQANSNYTESNLNELTTNEESQHETFADPFKVFEHFLSKMDEKIERLIKNPKFSPDSNTEDAILAISSDLDTNDIKDVNPFGSSFLDADQNETEEYVDGDFNGFVDF